MGSRPPTRVFPQVFARGLTRKHERPNIRKTLKPRGDGDHGGSTITCFFTGGAVQGVSARLLFASDRRHGVCDRPEAVCRIYGLLPFACDRRQRAAITCALLVIDIGGSAITNTSQANGARGLRSSALFKGSVAGCLRSPAFFK